MSHRWNSSVLTVTIISTSFTLSLCNFLEIFGKYKMSIVVLISLIYSFQILNITFFNKRLFLVPVTAKSKSVLERESVERESADEHKDPIGSTPPPSHLVAKLFPQLKRKETVNPDQVGRRFVVKPSLSYFGVLMRAYFLPALLPSDNFFVVILRVATLPSPLLLWCHLTAFFPGSLNLHI